MPKASKYLINFDYYLLFTFFALSVFGLIVHLDMSPERSLFIFYKQLIWSLISIFGMMFCFFFLKAEYLRKYILPLLIIIGIFLIYVLVNPHEVNGARRSIAIGPINFQPSLFARIFLIIFIADQLDKKKKLLPNITFKKFFVEFKEVVIAIGVIYALVLMEKHLSILIILTLVIFSLFWIAKLKFSTWALLLASFLLLGLVGGGLKSHISSKSNTAYRGKRLKVYTQYSLLTRSLGIKPSNYKGFEQDQVRESLIALSTGKMFGLGLGKGIAKNYFLSESRTDYIFSIIGEEFGFLGGLAVIILYIIFFWRIIRISFSVNDIFLRLTVLGLGLNLFYNAIVNIGVNISTLPSTGVTLPFISYGGTSFLINSLALGIILRISSKWKVRG